MTAPVGGGLGGLTLSGQSLDVKSHSSNKKMAATTTAQLLNASRARRVASSKARKKSKQGKAARSKGKGKKTTRRALAPSYACLERVQIERLKSDIAFMADRLSAPASTGEPPVSRSRTATDLKALSARVDRYGYCRGDREQTSLALAKLWEIWGVMLWSMAERVLYRANITDPRRSSSRGDKRRKGSGNGASSATALDEGGLSSAMRQLRTSHIRPAELLPTFTTLVEAVGVMSERVGAAQAQYTDKVGEVEGLNMRLEELKAEAKKAKDKIELMSTVIGEAANTNRIPPRRRIISALAKRREPGGAEPEVVSEAPVGGDNDGSAKWAAETRDYETRIKRITDRAVRAEAESRDLAARAAATTRELDRLRVIERRATRLGLTEDSEADFAIREARIEDLNKELSSVRADLQIREAAVNEVERRAAEARDRCAQMAAEKDVLAARVRSQESTIRDREARARQAAATIEELRQALRSRDAGSAALRGQLEMLREREREARERVETLAAKVAELTGRLAAYERGESELDALRKTAEARAARISALEAELKAERKRFDEERRDLLNEIDSLPSAGAVSALRSQLSDARRKSERAEKETVQVRQMLGDLRSRHRALEREAKEADSGRIAARAQADSAVRNEQEALQRSERLARELKSATEQCGESASRYTELEHETTRNMRELHDQIDRLRLELDKAQARASLSAEKESLVMTEKENLERQWKLLEEQKTIMQQERERFQKTAGSTRRRFKASTQMRLVNRDGETMSRITMPSSRGATPRSASGLTPRETPRGISQNPLFRGTARRVSRASSFASSDSLLKYNLPSTPRSARRGSIVENYEQALTEVGES